MKIFAKRFIALVLILSLTLSLFSGCSGSVPTATETPIATETPVETETPVSQYTVYFDAGDGTGDAPSSITAAAGETFTVPDNSFTRSGYAFNGYWTGWEYVYAGDSYVMKSQDMTFTAQWTAAATSSGGGGGGGSSSSSNSSSTSTTTTTLPTPSVTYSNGIISWGTITDATGYSITIAGETFTTTSTSFEILSATAQTATVKATSASSSYITSSAGSVTITAFDGKSYTATTENLYINGEITTLETLYSNEDYLYINAVSDASAITTTGTLTINAPDTHVEQNVPITAGELILHVDTNTFVTNAVIEILSDGTIILKEGTLVINGDINASTIVVDSEAQSTVSIVLATDSDSSVAIPNIEISSSTTADVSIDIQTEKEVSIDSQTIAKVDVSISTSNATVATTSTGKGIIASITIAEDAESTSLTNSADVSSVTVNGENSTIVNTGSEVTIVNNATGTQTAGSVAVDRSSTQEVAAQKSYISITGLSVSETMEYFGGTEIELTGTPTYLVNGEEDAEFIVSNVLDVYTNEGGSILANLDNKNYGFNKIVTPQISLKSGQDENYILILPTLTTQVTKKSIPTTIFSIEDKNYEETTVISVNTASAGIVSGDDVSFETEIKSESYGNKYSDTNATADIYVTLSGDDSTNYWIYEVSTLQSKFLIEGLSYEISGTHYKVTLSLYDSVTDTVDVAIADNTISSISTPTRSGYSFTGWYSDSACTSEITFPYIATKGITIYAGWERIVEYFTVTYQTNGGSEISEESVSDETEFTPATSPTKEGYTFSGWYTNIALSSEFVSGGLLTDDITLYAKWTANAYDVTFDANDGEGTMSSQAITYGESANLVANTFTKSWASFAGWSTTATGGVEYIDGANYEMTTFGATLYAVWTEIPITYNTITFNSNDGSEVSDRKVETGVVVTEPTEPTKEGYVFEGWYTDEDLTKEYSFTTPLIEDITLYAKWGEYKATEGLVFTLSNDKYSVTGYTGTDVDVYIPSTYSEDGENYYPVTSIASYAFKDNYTLISVIIPNSVDTIMSYAFYNTSIKSIIIPESVVSIGMYAFCSCGYLVIYVEEGAQISEWHTHWSYIGPSMSALVYWNINSDNYIVLNEAEYYIEDNYAILTRCISSDINFVVPSEITVSGINYSVKEIGYKAFYNLRTLKNIVIPESVESIGSYAFYNCTQLVNIDISYGLLYIGEYVFQNCGNLTSFETPLSLISIGTEAFRECASLNTIIIPISVETMGSWVFYGCDKLAIYNEISSAPSGWSSSWDYASGPIYWGVNEDSYIKVDGVEYCVVDDGVILTKYTSDNANFDMPNEIIINNVKYNITGIGDSAFYEVSTLETITLSTSIDSIGEYAFYGCTRLSDIIIPDGVSDIEDYTFAYCTFLENITIPTDIKTIGAYAFYECKYLNDMILLQNVTSIGKRAFSECLYLEGIAILSDIESIGAWAFVDSDNLIIYMKAEEENSDNWTSTWNSSNNLTYWSVDETTFLAEDGVYYYVNQYTDSSVPSATVVGKYAYAIEIAESITIDTITYTVTSIDENVINDGYIKIPGSVTTVPSFSSDVTCIMQNDNSDYDNYYFDNHSVIYLKQDNEYAVIDAQVLNKYEILSNIDGLSVTSIGNDAFYNQALISITIPSTITSIGNNAFYLCTGLRDISIPSSVESIGTYAFYYCVSLENVELAEGLYTIGMYAFKKCTGLTSITIPLSVTGLWHVFSECPGLIIYSEAEENPSWSGHVYVTNNPLYYNVNQDTFIQIDGVSYYIQDNQAILTRLESDIVEYEIPNEISIGDNVYSVATIGDYAFYGCENLISVIFEENSELTSIGDTAFYNCTSLVSIIIPDGVKTIGDSTFYYCNNLKRITIPDGVTSIGDTAFYNCNSLESITIPEGVTSIGSYAFSGCTNLTIYAEATSESSDWYSTWNSSDCPVYWGLNSTWEYIDGIPTPIVTDNV